MSAPLTAKDGSLFVQLTPGKAPEYIGCLDLDAIAEPRGDQTLIRCRDLNGDFQTIGSTEDPPGNVTASLTALVFKDSDILDEIKRCLVNLYAMQRDCGRAGVFGNYVRALIVHHAKLTNRSESNLVMREAGDPSTRTLDFSAWNPVYRIRQVTARSQSIAETTDLNAIAFCNAGVCAGDCGENKDPYIEGFIGGDAPAGSPAALADVWQTDDGGANWSNITGGAAHPFAAGEDVLAVGCFLLDRSTTRWIAVREQVVGEPLKIAYSDDGGATWTLVTVGSTNNEGAAGAGALWAPDRDHLWLATTAGNVYFSDDAGLTWTAQADALTASGGNSLNVVQFADADNGYAVGDSDTIIQTTDGGETWEAIAAPGSGDNITALHVWTRYRVIVGQNDGNVYETWNAGAAWEAKAYSGQAGTDTVKAIHFVNDLTGFMIVNTSAPVGSIHRSIDGGHNFEKLATPTNAGLNGLFVADENTAYAVGNASGGTGIVIKVSG